MAAAPVESSPASAGGPTDSSEAVRVVICGGGPSGLLLAHYLLSLGRGQFHVSIFDRAPDPRLVLSRGLDSRRWSVGLQLRAKRSFGAIPGLAEKVLKASVETQGLGIILSSSKPPVLFKPRRNEFPGWVQDRVALCALLLQALLDDHATRAEGGGAPEAEGAREVLSGPCLRVRFECACTGVDLNDQTATFAPTTGPPIALNYDLLVGADGLRSVVRGAFQAQMREFEFEQKGVFTEWGVTHFPYPQGMDPNTTYLVPKLPKSECIQSIFLPSVHGECCLVMGWNSNEHPKEWLACSTPEEASLFFKDRLPQFQVGKEAAWKLRSTPTQTSMQIKCSQYHDSKGRAVLVGDAAHCTCASLGSGVNAALVDASVLGRLLCGELVGPHSRVPKEDFAATGPEERWSGSVSADEVRERMPNILARYSALQVPEGHNLVDLSDAFLPVTPAAKLLNAIITVLFTFLHYFLPFLFPPTVLGLLTTTTSGFSEIFLQWRPVTSLLLWNKQQARLKWGSSRNVKELSKGI